MLCYATLRFWRFLFPFFFLVSCVFLGWCCQTGVFLHRSCATLLPTFSVGTMDLPPSASWERTARFATRVRPADTGWRGIRVLVSCMSTSPSKYNPQWNFSRRLFPTERDLRKNNIVGFLLGGGDGACWGSPIFSSADIHLTRWFNGAFQRYNQPCCQPKCQWCLFSFCCFFPTAGIAACFGMYVLSIKTNAQQHRSNNCNTRFLSSVTLTGDVIMCYKSKQLTHDSLEMGVLKINLDRLACKEPTTE